MTEEPLIEQGIEPWLKDKESAEYVDYFRYMVEHHSFPQKPSPIERFYVMDIEENQYPRLEGPVSDQREEFGSPDEAANVIREFALSAGADLVGFARITDDMIFKGARIKGDYAISLALQMDRKAVDTAPEPPAGMEALRAYWRLGWIVMKTAEFIRYLGYPAQGHQVRTFLKDPPSVIHPAVAVGSGLGEIGRTGILISREFGPRVRLGTITTDLVLPDTGKRGFGVEEFCSGCTICADNCRGKAIPLEKTMVRGILKYKMDPYRCIPEFARYDGCGICLRVCPFNRPEDEADMFLSAVERMRNTRR